MVVSGEGRAVCPSLFPTFRLDTSTPYPYTTPMTNTTPARDERTIRLMAEALRPEAREAFIQYMLAYEEERAKSANQL